MNRSADKPTTPVTLFFLWGTLLCGVLLLPGIAFPVRAGFAAALAGGFATPYMWAGNALSARLGVSGIAATLTCVWLLLRLVPEILRVGDTLPLWTKATLLLAGALSLSADNARIRFFVRLLSFAAFLCALSMQQEITARAVILFCAFCILLLLATRQEFWGDERVGRYEGDVRRRSWVPAVFFLGIAAALTLPLTLHSAKQTIDPLVAGKVIRSPFTEEEYYSLRDKLQSALTRVALSRENPARQMDYLGHVAALIKDTPDTVETKRALLGLVAPLPIPGPGIERSATNEPEALVLRINHFLRRKSRKILIDATQESARTIFSSAAPFARKWEEWQNVRRLRWAPTPESIRRALQKVHQGNASFSARETVQLHSYAATISQWQIFYGYASAYGQTARLVEKEKGIARQQLKRLMLSVAQAETPQQWQEVVRSFHEMTALFSGRAQLKREFAALLLFKQELLFPQGQLRTKRPVPVSSRAPVRATATAGKRSFPSAAAHSAPAGQSVPAGQAVVSGTAHRGTPQSILSSFAAVSRRRRVFWMIILLALVILAVCLLRLLFVSVLLRRRLRALLAQPRLYIIGLYDYLMRATTLFSFRGTAADAPVEKAQLLEQCYRTGSGAFVSLTWLYAEAKYSSHAISQRNALEAAGFYRDAARALAGNRGAVRRLLKRVQAQWRGIPLSV